MINNGTPKRSVKKKKEQKATHQEGIGTIRVILKYNNNELQRSVETLRAVCGNEFMISGRP